MKSKFQSPKTDVILVLQTGEVERDNQEDHLMTVWIVIGIVAIILLMPVLKAMGKTVPRWLLVVLLIALTSFAVLMFYDLLAGRGNP